MKARLAIDVGGSTSRATLVDLTGRCLGQGRNRGGNPGSNPPEQAAAAIIAAAQAAAEEAGGPLEVDVAQAAGEEEADVGRGRGGGGRGSPNTTRLPDAHAPVRDDRPQRVVARVIPLFFGQLQHGPERGLLCRWRRRPAHWSRRSSATYR